MRRTSKQALTIRVEEYLPYPVSQVWRALTDTELLARWLMPNDFKLELGHRFTFRTAPMPAVGFDGVIHCEVLSIEPLRRLEFTWRGGRGLDSVVTWRLEPEGDGTRMFIEHTGFDAEDAAQRLAYDEMGKGWRSHILARLRGCLAEAVRSPGS